MKTLALLSFSFILLFSQCCDDDLNNLQEVFLQNSSFENEIGENQIPSDWIYCNDDSTNTPDIQPGIFEVTIEAFEGDSYIGLTTNSDGSTEGLGQILTEPLEANLCYEFEAHIARSLIYLQNNVNHFSPNKLQIWGCDSNCEKLELLAETSVIINSRWLNYSFEFEPSVMINSIFLECSNKEPILFPYNGNILLDALSPIKQVKCD